MSYEIDIVAVIGESFGQLRDAEKKVAQVVLADLNFAANASISELAQSAQVSEASITRFAKAIHCKNVRDLKFRIAQSIAVGERFITDVNVEPTGISGIYDSIKSALEHNSQLITQQLVDQATEKLSNARQIFIFGVGGGSTVLAQEMQYRLFRLGYAATAYSDPMLMRMAASTIDSNDALICLSMGGYSPDVLESAEIAQQFHSNIIAITKADTPLAEIADVLLPMEPKETDYIFKPSASRYVMMAAIDILATELAIKHKRKSREKLRRLKQSLEKHRGGVDRQPLGD
ncbi:MurR/RpiR family transcriptional regulator [Psychromonas aquimarina]|uniref:MurR/RpiR family transcriptional regulator n=1 Tax=Psychromonas aquimarina TaxID=444919 RepID=UPI0004026F95|nr:MurR/RpiR family transcriptional regulator [Psychromonas aquimarina]